jgi:hypothetical protein
MTSSDPITRGECDIRHAQIMAVLAGIQASTSETNARLYKDNGHVSIQTKLDRHERILGVLCWVATVVSAPALLGAAVLLWRAMMRAA